MVRQLGPPPPATSNAVSKSMKSNRPVDTGPEMILRRALHKAGLRGYRVHQRGLPGRPDIAFTKQKVAVFVNGCFWHSCPICLLPAPRTHASFWKTKFELNVRRDQVKIDKLRAEGWKVVVVWEHEIKSDLSNQVNRIARVVRIGTDSKTLLRR